MVKTCFIAVANLKGGTGKTTIASWLSYALAYLGRRVVMIDIDPQAHLTSIWLNVSEGIEGNVWRYVYGIETRGLLKEVLLKEVLGPRYDVRDRIRLIASDISEYVDFWRLGRSVDPQIASQFRKEVVLKNYDYIIVDCPPDPVYAKLGIYMSDYIIIPTDLSSISLRGTRLFTTQIVPHAMRLNDHIKLLGIIVNKVFRRRIPKRESEILNDIENELLKIAMDIRDRIHRPLLFNTIIPQNKSIGAITLEKEEKKRKPVLRIPRYFKRKSEVSQIFIRLAQEIENRIRYFQGYT
jgi:chromosome partitioning protein